nr:mobilization protein [Alistipes sp.]
MFLSDKLGFVRQKRSLCEAGRSPESNAFLSDTMDNNQKLTDKTEKKPRTPSYKYSFRLNEEQNIRFNELLCKAGSEHNRSHFIVKRIFAEEFVVIRRDLSKVQFVARLNDFYFQFQKLANNYNQIVKAVNAHFSNVAIPHQIALLEQRTRELKTLSIEILNLAKQAKEWLRI